MELARPEMISQIDRFVINDLGIPEAELVRRSGAAVAAEIERCVPYGGSICIFAGGGNNGADGYSAALLLSDKYRVTVFDALGKGQRSDTGKALMNEFAGKGDLRVFKGDDRDLDVISSADCVVDAVFGTGYSGTVSDALLPLARAMKNNGAFKVAVDVPLGVNPGDGSVNEEAFQADVTVELSYIKTGIVSYPARSFTGRVVLDEIGIDREKVRERFIFCDRLIDEDEAARLLPVRPENSNKGTFGKVFMVAGSSKYRGAAFLSLEAAMRSGAGMVHFYGDAELIGSLLPALPEAIYKTGIIGRDIDVMLESAAVCGTAVIGSGCGNSKELYAAVSSLLGSECCKTIVLDADALNCISEYGVGDMSEIRSSASSVIITPHPLEFSRLCGKSVDVIQGNRLTAARSFAQENKCTVLLKGAATVITDGERTYINQTGSSALAKGGSGDVLSGVIAAFSAQGMPPLEAAALAAYYHGSAADSLAEKYSHFGVLPSDLPKEIAEKIAVTEKTRSIKK